MQKPPIKIHVLCDDAGTDHTLGVPGIHEGTRPTVFLHEVTGTHGDRSDCKKVDVTPDQFETRTWRSEAAFRLLDESLPLLDRSLGWVVAGFRYTTMPGFADGLAQRDLGFVLEIPKKILRMRSDGTFFLAASGASIPLKEILDRAEWRETEFLDPTGQRLIPYAVTELGRVRLSARNEVRLVAARKGVVESADRDTLLTAASVPESATAFDIADAGVWVRRILPFRRRLLRNGKPPASLPPKTLPARPNITLGRLQDSSLAAFSTEADSQAFAGRLAGGADFLNVVELFAGGGGLGLGFLLAESRPTFRLAFSGEVHPVYAETLRRNHAAFDRLFLCDRTPADTKPFDLRQKEAKAAIREIAARLGQVDVVVGGPPCQGFSASNRNSNADDNPHNQHINTFLDYIQDIQPSVFLLENVQGILWAPTKFGISVVEYVSRRMEGEYLVFPKLLDAVWYGVPQHRTRCFVLGIHRRLGYIPADFGKWGPFPVPTHGPGLSSSYVTVADALGDLPRIGNGHFEPFVSYSGTNGHPFLGYVRKGAESGQVSDHVTSRHAPYVLERYAAIREGGNWQDVKDLLANYTERDRTHSNIYRRLRWNEPSVTIGHYRKSMLIHPGQNRGLSLREAARLQSFPDWFRFAGCLDSVSETAGLSHKQQQLANAVCPLLAKAVAETIARL